MTIAEFSGRRSPDLSWKDFMKEANELAEQISTNVPDVIVAIARGGLVPAGVLGYILGVRAILIISVEKQGEERRLTMSTGFDLRDKTVLAVGDITKTGKSLKAVRDHLILQGAFVRTACLHTTSDSEIQPDYSLGQIQNIPKYPWKV